MAPYFKIIPTLKEKSSQMAAHPSKYKIKQNTFFQSSHRWQRIPTKRKFYQHLKQKPSQMAAHPSNTKYNYTSFIQSSHRWRRNSKRNLPTLKRKVLTDGGTSVKIQNKTKYFLSKSTQMAALSNKKKTHQHLKQKPSQMATHPSSTNKTRTRFIYALWYSLSFASSILE